MRLQRAKERASEGRKKFLTCLRCMRAQEFPLLHKSFRSGKADTAYPLSNPVLPISPSCPTSYPPYNRCCIHALYHVHAGAAVAAAVGVLHAVYPFRGGAGFTFI